jgi:hypothetical protein
MSTIDRWLKWRRPGDQDILTLGSELTKLTKLSDEPAKPAMPQPVAIDGDYDPLDKLRSVFVAWFDARIKLDAAAVALRTPPVWMTAVTALHLDCSRYVLERDLVPPTEAEFRQLLTELGSTILTVDGEEVVANVALKEDVSHPSPQPKVTEVTPAPAVPVDEGIRAQPASPEDEHERLTREVHQLVDSEEGIDDDGIHERIRGRQEDVERAVAAAIDAGLIAFEGGPDGGRYVSRAPALRKGVRLVRFEPKTPARIPRARP